jgi:hypothetical protein
MNKEQIQFQKFLKAEERYVQISKYYEGINTKRDPGDRYVLDWIHRFAEEFRAKWNVSQCKDCFDADKCGDKLKPFCPNVKEYPKELQ